MQNQPPKRKHSRKSERIKHAAKFLTDYAIADRLQVSRPTVWRWVRAGSFPPPSSSPTT